MLRGEVLTSLIVTMNLDLSITERLGFVLIELGSIIITEMTVLEIRF